MEFGGTTPERRSRPIERSRWPRSMPDAPARNISRQLLPSPLKHRLGLFLSGSCRSEVERAQAEVELPKLQSAFVWRLVPGIREFRR